METPRAEHIPLGARVPRGSFASTPDMASTLAEHLAAHEAEMARIGAELEAIRTLKSSLGALRKEAHARVRELTEPTPTIESALASVALGLAANKRQDVALPEEMSTLITDILDRALTNVAHHAAATETNVSVKVEDRWIFVSLFDDGRGGAIVVPGHSLDTIRQRVSRAGGHFSLSSPAQRGTLLTIALPFTTTATEASTTMKELPR